MNERQGDGWGWYLFADVGIARAKEFLDLVGEIARHFLRCYVGECA